MRQLGAEEVDRRSSTVSIKKAELSAGPAGVKGSVEHGRMPAWTFVTIAAFVVLAIAVVSWAAVVGIP